MQPFFVQLFAFILNIRRNKEPFNNSLTSTNQENSASRTSGALDFRPPPTALVFTVGQVEGSMSYQLI